MWQYFKILVSIPYLVRLFGIWHLPTIFCHDPPWHLKEKKKIYGTKFTLVSILCKLDFRTLKLSDTKLKCFLAFTMESFKFCYQFFLEVTFFYLEDYLVWCYSFCQSSFCCIKKCPIFVGSSQDTILFTR